MVSARMARQAKSKSRTVSGLQPAHLDQRGEHHIDGGNDGRGADEGDVEEKDQQRNAADDFDIEGGDLAQHGLAEVRARAMSRPNSGGGRRRRRR